MKQGQNAIFREGKGQSENRQELLGVRIKIAKAINSTETLEDKIEELATKGNSIENGREKLINLKALYLPKRSPERETDSFWDRGFNSPNQRQGL